jgi:signal transduction histidine kinase
VRVTGESLAVTLAWLASGLASVALAPRHGTSRALCVAGVAILGAALTWPAAARIRSGPGAALLPELGDLAALTAIVALVAVVLTFPDGVLRRRGHRSVLTVFAALALAGPLLRLIGSPTLTANGDGATTRSNPLAVPRVHLLGEAGDLIWNSSPAWLVIALALLVPVWRSADAVGRRALRPLLGGLGVVGVLLVLVVVAEVHPLPLPERPFEVVFLLSLAVLPVVLLAGISARTRALAGELAASRHRMAAAEDRARISLERDLHDGVQQQLVAILSLTQLALRQSRRGDAAVPVTLETVSEQVTGTIGELRELVSGIRPPVLADSGVAAAVESRLGAFPSSAGVDLRLDADGVRARRWAPETEAVAYFVVCEAVTNAVKHAPGAAVCVRLAADGADLVVEVTDDGPGLPQDRPEGRGLTGLQDRVESAGGSFSAGRHPAGGTVVTARLPA